MEAGGTFQVSQTWNAAAEVWAKKNRGARLRRGGFPYNLMKSHKSGGQCLPLLFCSPPLSFIDDTKVQDTRPVAKDKKSRLLRSRRKGFWGACSLNFYIKN